MKTQTEIFIQIFKLAVIQDFIEQPGSGDKYVKQENWIWQKERLTYIDL